MHKPPMFVAELSANHLGDPLRGERLISAAVEAGADAVKLQVWTRDLMVGDRSYVVQHGPWKDRTLVDLYNECWLPWDAVEHLFAFGRAAGIEVFASVFDRFALSFLEQLNCPRYKIASAEIVDLDLIQAVAATDKPLIISTGMATVADVENAYVASLRIPPRRPENLTLLKCTAAYPAKPEHMNLAKISALREMFDCNVGLSDHTIGIAAPVVATTLGATMIERHLTLNRKDGGPDAAFSSQPDEFAAMVRECRAAAAAIGDELFTMGPTPGEHVELRRSMYAATDIEAGEPLNPRHMMAARPALGLKPAEYPALLGRRALAKIKAGTPISAALFKDPSQEQIS